MDRIAFLGDSICFGLGDNEGGWVGRLQKTKPQTQFFNLGVPGQTMAEIHARAENEVRARMRDDLEFGIVLGGGLNDLCEDENGIPRTDKPALLSTINALIKTLSALAPLLVIGPATIDERLDPAFIDALGKNMFFKNDLILDINKAYAEIYDRYQIPYLNLISELRTNATYNQALAEGDYVHPAPIGYQEIAKFISNWQPWAQLGTQLT